MKTYSLNAKIILIMGVLIVGSILISIVGISKMGEINADLEVIADTLSPRMMASSEIRADFRQLILFERTHILSKTAEEHVRYEKELHDLHEHFRTGWEEAYKLASEEGKTRLKSVDSRYKEWLNVHAEIIRLSKSDKKSEAGELSVSKGAEFRKAIEADIKELIAMSKETTKDRVVHAGENYDNARQLTILLSVLALVIGCGIAFIVLRAVARSIDSVISKLQDSSAQVSSAADQISSSSEELSQAATEQAASLEETAASVEEISSMVTRNAESAKKAAALASSSHESASKGKEVVANMIAAIGEINASNSEISDIVKVIAEIGNKTKVINDIVFQTKLLSFNASVEAARAGEHGKGFAVVAEEVGNLAQMSGNAAKEISSMLESSIQKVERLVATSRDKVEVGTRVAGECGDVLDEIVTNVANVTSMASEIAKASDEQSRGIGEITRAMSQLDQVTQQNASSAEEAASSSEELAAQATSLSQVVGELIVAVKGGEQSLNHNYRGIATPTLGKRGGNRPVAQQQGGKVLTFGNATNKRNPGTGKGRTIGPDIGAGAAPLKKAVGMNVTPSGNDPRFEDV